MENVLGRDEKTGIMYKRWICPSPKAVFLLVHGLGAFSSRWDFLAQFFLQNNISSYAIELKGFGETQSPKGHIDSFNIYFRDIISLYDIIKKENKGRKIFLIGESLGALISFLLAAREPDLFDGLICLSPAFRSRLKFTLMNTMRILSSLLFNPTNQVQMPFDSKMCTRDVELQKMMDNDKREHRVATSKLLLNIALAEMRVDFLKNKIKKPVLFLTAGALDKITDASETIRVFKNLEEKDKEIIQYPEMVHALSVELGREKVFNDILQWVSKRI